MYYVKKSIKNLYRISGRQGRSQYLRLDMNENPNGLPNEFVEKVKKGITSEFLAMYPEPERLECIIADYLQVAQNQICLTNGSDEGIRFIFELFARPGKEVVSIDPTFEMYRVYCEMFGLVYKSVSYSEQFKINVSNIIEKIHEDTDLVILLNPNNPIGTAFSKEDAELIIKRAKKYNAVVVVDEAYHYFYNQTFLPFIKKYNHIILLRTFSKLLSLAACRLGFTVASKELTCYIRKARPSFNVNGIALQFGEEILKDKQLIHQLVEEERQGKQYLIKELKRNHYQVYAYEGNFVFFKPKISASMLADRMEQEKILIKTFRNNLLKDYVRITTGKVESMMYFLEKLVEKDR